MTPPIENIRKMVVRYIDIFRNVKPESMPEDPTNPKHILWMLNEIHKGEMETTKLHRWLGYVQGVMVCQGHINVQEERELTRPLLTTSKAKWLKYPDHKPDSFGYYTVIYYNEVYKDHYVKSFLWGGKEWIFPRPTKDSVIGFLPESYALYYSESMVLGVELSKGVDVLKALEQEIDRYA
jgi:hypothetical protein